MAVHHIHVDAINSATLGFGHLFAQPGKVGRENGRRPTDRVHDASSVFRQPVA
jgi:hypothetical protein